MTVEKMKASPYYERESGLSCIGRLPWKTHFCQLYSTKEDLLEILLPFLKAGLKNNELCLWVASAPITVQEAGLVLKHALPDFERHVREGQIRLMSAGRWRAEERAGTAIASKLKEAISKGWDGVRFFVQRRGKTFLTAADREAVDRFNVIVASAYPREKLNALSIMDVARKHRFALVRYAGKWEVLESSEVQVKDDLRRSEERLRSLFTNMSEGFAYHRILVDNDGKPCDFMFLEVNKSFEKLTGLKRKEIIGRLATEVLPGIECDQADWIGRYGRVALTGQPAQFESYSEALEKWYAVSTFSSHPGYFAVTFSDITARREGEAALRNSNRKLEILAEAAALLLTSEKPERIVETICKKVMNHLSCDIFFNYLTEEGKERMRLNAYAGIPQAKAAEIEFLDYGAAVCGCVARDSCRMIAEDILNSDDERTGLVRSFGVQAYVCHPLIFMGRTIGTLSFGARDRKSFSAEDIDLMNAITNLVASAMVRKQAEDRILDLNKVLKNKVDDLSEAVKDLESFSYTVSHDLRAPLRAIDGYSRMLERNLPVLDEKSRRQLNVIRRNSQIMAQLIEDLLNYSRLGNQKMSRAEVDLSQLARMIYEEIKDPGRAVEFSVKDTPPAYCDRTLLRQVIANLLNNAVKFTQFRDEAKIEFGGFVRSHRKVYYVKDNGVGFDMQYVGNMFGVFQRLHGSGEFEGTGVGLAIVERIIQKHRGSVWAEGKPGEGATIFFSLPGRAASRARQDGAPMVGLELAKVGND